MHLCAASAKDSEGGELYHPGESIRKTGGPTKKAGYSSNILRDAVGTSLGAD